MEDIIGKNFLQKCGDVLKVIDITDQKQGTSFLYKCSFLAYPSQVLALKTNIVNGKVGNPDIENYTFIGQSFLQNCGDTLTVLKKSDTKQSGATLYECQFSNYNCLALKGNILKGQVNNPNFNQISVGEEFLQNCGDTLKVIAKKENLYECEFKKYPYKVLVSKSTLLSKSINNPLIEAYDFIGKEYLQNCGDTLKVINRAGDRFKCEFINYPSVVYASKYNILYRTVNNPQIEASKFINQVFEQNCGDSLRILNKTTNQIKEKGNFLFEAEFIKYPCRVLVLKDKVLQGAVENPNLPYKSKDSLKKYIESNFTKKPTLSELSESLQLSPSLIGRSINDFGLREFISYNYSSLEEEVRSYVRELDSTVSDREYNLNGISVDIYFPNKSFGIEINGDYWHSELYRDKDYHQDKKVKLKSKDIDLVHIYEYEWRDIRKQNILKHLIQSKLGIFNKKIFARKCIVKVLSQQQYKNFCNEYHLQGYCAASIKLGLFTSNWIGANDDELVQVMSFSKPRFTDKYEYECIRECSKFNYFILGGKEKLWRYFIKTYQPSSVVSYCDFSKFKGDSYLKLGFSLLQLNKPGFVWYDLKTKEVLWRNPYKHQEIKEKGYLKIYDAGQLVYIYNN